MAKGGQPFVRKTQSKPQTQREALALRLLMSHGGPPLGPRLLGEGERHVDMEYLKGKSLQENFGSTSATHHKHFAGAQERLRREFHRRTGRSHGDLRLKNVIWVKPANADGQMEDVEMKDLRLMTSR